MGTSAPRTEANTEVSPTPHHHDAWPVRARENNQQQNQNILNPCLCNSLLGSDSKMLTADQKKMLWQGISTYNKKRMMHVSALRNTEGSPVVWEEEVGKEAPVMITTVPIEFINTDKRAAEFKEKVSTLLGTQGETSFVLGADGNPNGEIMLRTLELSEEGARRLTRGYWRPDKATENMDEGMRGFFVHNGQTIGTEVKPKYKLKTENVMEVRWNPKHKTSEGCPCPNKTAMYAALEYEEARTFNQGVGVPANEMIDPTTGAVTEEEYEAVNKVDFAAGWRLAQGRIVHAHAPAYIQFHNDRESPPKLSHRGRGDNENERAQVEQFAVKIRFPTGYYKEVKEAIARAAEKLGIELDTEGHPFANYSIRDLLESYKSGKPMLDGKVCTTRALLKVNSVMAESCNGITTPAELSAWLHQHNKVHYVGSIIREDMVVKGDAPPANAYAFMCLVEMRDPMQMMKLNNHRVSGSDAVTIRNWNASVDGKGSLRILPNELFVAMGAVSVVPQKKAATTQATSAGDLVTKLAEEAKKLATQKGLEESGYMEATQKETIEILLMQKKVDASSHQQKKRELQQQIKAIEAEEKLQREAEANELEGKEKAKKQPNGKPQNRTDAARISQDITIEIRTENGKSQEIEVDVGDVPPGNGQRPTVMDLARYVHEMQGFGTDFGLNAQDCEQFKGEPIKVPVYITAKWEGELGKSWCAEIGKEGTGGAANMKKIDTMTGGRMTLEPRQAAKPPPNHPAWMQANIGAPMASPSPGKRGAGPMASVRPQLPWRELTVRCREGSRPRGQAGTDSKNSPWTSKKSQIARSPRARKRLQRKHLRKQRGRPERTNSSKSSRSRSTQPSQETPQRSARTYSGRAKDSASTRRWRQACSRGASSRARSTPWCKGPSERERGDKRKGKRPIERRKEKENSNLSGTIKEVMKGINTKQIYSLTNRKSLRSKRDQATKKTRAREGRRALRRKITRRRQMTGVEGIDNKETRKKWEKDRITKNEELNIMRTTKKGFNRNTITKAVREERLGMEETSNAGSEIKSTQGRRARVKQGIGGRVWGSRGKRIGEASHPGPEKEDEEDDARTVDRDVEREIQKQFGMAEETDARAHHKHWIGSKIGKKGKHIGARIITINFQRKLYGSKENVIELIERCEELGVDIIVGTEPGQGSPSNLAIFNGLIGEFGYKANYSVRDSKTIGGGCLIMTNEKWSKIPTSRKAYEPPEREQKGRIMSVIFDNKLSGAHNKFQVIAMHGLNSAQVNEEQAIRQLQWIQKQLEEFSLKNPLASSMVAGDMNAAENTHLDTNRQEKEGRAVDEEEEEKDAFVIKTLRTMKLVDMFRARYPRTRATTRTGAGNDASRLLDRIMVTAEAAANPLTEIGIFREQLLTAGSDHRMVLVDLPVDTAGVATERVEIWEPRTITKWVRDTDEVGNTDPKKVEAFKERLDETREQVQLRTHEQYCEWVMEAARGTVMKASTRTYPKKASTRKLYTPSDHKLRANLRALRNARQEIDEGRAPKRTIKRLQKKLNAVTETATDSAGIRGVLKAIEDPNGEVGAIRVQEITNKIETYLSSKNRLSRAIQIRKSIKTRNIRFNDSGKLMLKLVINSLMRRHTEREDITSVIEGIEMKYGEDEVKKTVKEFYEQWMSSRVSVEDRFESWDDMMKVDAKKLKDPVHKEIMEQAYSESREKFSKLQESEGIWNAVRKSASMGELCEALKRMKKGTAPGPSGLSYDLLGMMTKEQLKPLLDIINEALESGKVERGMNLGLLRLLPKTEEGLADLGKTRPIALMEAALKLLERIMFTRVMEIIKEHDMLRGEQHGGLPGKTVKSPIRNLTEMMEDAIMGGKELHIFSADIAKAFDSIEYWSQALSWGALGMPEDLIQMLVDMDSEGETAVILGQGRKTEWYKNGRGVRQGSIGGPIKWVVFINFWLEYVYKVAEGKGYRMTEAEEGDGEVLGQVFVDDSNWFAPNKEGMETLIKLGEDFTEFHGLKFNKGKCEYLAINQERGADGEYEVPEWKDGEKVQAKLRRHASTGEEKERAKRAERKIKELCWGAVEEGDEKVIVQPSDKEYGEIDKLVKEWKQALVDRDQGRAETRKQAAKAAVNAMKIRVYGKVNREGIKEWAEEMEVAIKESNEYTTGKGKATRYLGVMFEVEMGWKKQKEVLEVKFKDAQRRICSTRPTKEQAIYLVNAVINAAMKYPLQVAQIPRATLRRWDSANRTVVRRAGALPKSLGDLLHEPKEKGGAGLQSLEMETIRMRATDQIEWLNSDNITGQIVRAARKRWRKSKGEKGTIQQHSMEAVKELGAEIVASAEQVEGMGRTEWIVNYPDVVAQRREDMATAEKVAREHVVLHAFGDGATWTDQDEAGWGSVITKEGDRNTRSELRSTRGRVAGKQTNDSAETTAILGSLLNTHLEDDMVIYCDNQGCVDVWHRITREMEGTQVVSLSTNNRALWNRILGMAKARKERGAETIMRWVHSHVDDEDRRKDTTKAKYQCACGKIGECTVMGEEGHWAHEGNERADEEAGEGAKEERPEPWQTAAGDMGYIIRCIKDKHNMAQGKYSYWTKTRESAEVRKQESMARKKIRGMREASHEGAFNKLMKQLGRKEIPSWRFWSRLVLESLPTHSQMARYAASSDENKYKTVYESTIGEHGRCVRCGEEKETTRHAVFQCEDSRPKWEKLHRELEGLWEEYGEDWNQFDWLDPRNQKWEGWQIEHGIAGLVPRQLEKEEGLNTQDIGIKRLLNDTSAMIIGTAYKAWERRNEKVKEWIETIPELKERKDKANRTGWKTQGKEKKNTEPREEVNPEEIQNRLKRLKKEVEIAEKREVARFEKAMDVEMEKYEEQCRKSGETRKHPGEREEERKVGIKEKMKGIKAWGREVRKKAKIAEGTRDLEKGEMGTGTMGQSQPMVSTAKRKYHWIPRMGLHVKVLWTAPAGEKVGNLKGAWWSGKVVGLSWPEGEGIPGVSIKGADGSIEWHGIDMCGITIKPAKEPRKVRNLPYDTVFDPQVLEWLGKGSRVRVKWKGPGWCQGTVVGEDRHGIIVRYSPGGETVAHTNLNTVGCKVDEFRRREEEREPEPWEKCPYGGDEVDCECMPCERRKWPVICDDLGIDQGKRRELMGTEPWERKGLIQRWGLCHDCGGGEDINRNNGGHLVANASKRRRGDGDREADEEGHSEEARDDGDPEAARPRSDKNQRGKEQNRLEAGGQDLGVGGGSGRDERPQTQGHGAVDSGVDGEGRKRAAEGEGPGSVGPRRSRRIARAGADTQDGNEGNDHDMDQGERGAEGGGTCDPARAETQADASGQKEGGETERGSERCVRDSGDPGCRGGGDPGAPAEQIGEGDLGHVGGGLGEMDAGIGLGDVCGGGSQDGKRSGRKQRRASEREREAPGDRHRRRMGEREENAAGNGGTKHRSGQEGIHIHGSEGRHDHVSDHSRPDYGDKRRSAEGHSQEGREGGEVMDDGVAFTGMLAAVDCERNQPEERVSTWEVGLNSEEQKGGIGSGPGAGEGISAGGSGEHAEPVGGSGGGTGNQVRSRKPSNVGALEDDGGDQGGRKEPGMEEGESGPMCLRQAVTEADHDSDKPDAGTVEPEGRYRKRQMQDGGVRRHCRERERGQEARGADSAEHQGKKARSGREDGGQMGLHETGSGQRSGGRTGGGDHKGGDKRKRGANADLRQERENHQKSPHSGAACSARCARCRPSLRRPQDRPQDKLTEDPRKYDYREMG